MSLQTLIDNPYIQQLADKPFWTVNIHGKMPMDFKGFLTDQQIRGAKDKSCLVSMTQILNYFMSLPTPATPEQFVYSLDCMRDNVVILDIESKCPEDIKRRLMTELPYVYGDISMSGNGAHLMFPCPPLDELTSKKIVMKEEHGWYEILLQHYCSFTLSTLPPSNLDTNDQTAFLKLWDELREQQKLFEKKDVDVTLQRPDLSFKECRQLKADILARFRSTFKKTLEDYNNDNSRYEFGVISSLKFAQLNILGYPQYAKLDLSENQRIWIIYELLPKILEPRPKHEETRDGMPWLLWRVCNCFAIKDKSAPTSK